MKVRYPFLVFCLLASALVARPAQAQTNFQPGYVLPLAGDTLRGEVDARDARASASRCRFRSSPQAEATTYLPGQLRGYGFTAGNQYYRSIALPVGDGTPQPGFFQVLVDGPASLYLLVGSERRDDFYLGLKNQPIVLLKHGIIQVVRGNETTPVVDTGYRNTLAAALPDCPAVQKMLPHLPYNQNQLVDIVDAYNARCLGVQTHRAQPGGSKSHVSFGIMAGVVRHTLTYEGYPYATGSKTERTHTGVAVGPVFKFSTSRLGERFSVVASLLYEPEQYELEGERPSNNGFGPTKFRQTFDLGYLRFPVVIRYTYPRGKIMPIAEAGVTAAFAIRAKNSAEYLDSQGSFYRPFSNAPGSGGDYFRATQTGLGAGIGAETHLNDGRALALLIRYESANGFHAGTEVGTTIAHFYGLLSFNLTK